jgi:Autographiviridae endonuclease
MSDNSSTHRQLEGMTQLLQRLHARSHQEGECLIWDGSVVKDGYGQIQVAGKVWKVHRLAWTEWHGPIPPDKVVRHFGCDNPRCWQVTHLKVGTQAENMDDMTTKGRRRSGDHWPAKRAAKRSTS